MNTALLALAQQAPGCGGGGGIGQLGILLMFMVVFYFMLIRPQQKRAKEQANMLGALKKGDQVITRGGIIGKISGVQDNMITLELQDKVRVRVVKSYVEGKFQEAGSVKATTEKAEPAPSESKT